MNWTARLTTASRDGRTWEHAVAELWSNQFGKWFVLDTDFNIVYEHKGVPLSAFELVHDGEALQRRGELTVRAIAAPKPSLPYQDLLPFYRYVHFDLRNDWCSRWLPRGSPSGGDLATWWTARPTMHWLITAKPRVDDREVFNWPVNWTAAHPSSARRDEEGRLVLEMGFVGYSATFRGFEMSVDHAGWCEARSGHRLSLERGRHLIRVRLITRSGYAGSPAEIELEWT